MKKPILMSLAFTLLLACGGNPLDGGDPVGGGGGALPETPTASGVPESLRLDLKGASYVPGDPTITIALSFQDATALNATYVRTPALDRPDYFAYTFQESTSNRYVIAMVRQSGSAKAAAVMDAGQFANYFGGTTYARADVYSLPLAGVGPRYNYSGSYVGLMNIGVPAPGGPGGGLGPEQAYVTEGRALITADFTEMKISGGVDNRVIINPALDDDPVLDSISLGLADIAADGSFFGPVFTGSSDAGVYGGVFAGIEARDVAAVLVFYPYKNPPTVEHGLIVLTNCVDAGGPACSP